MVNEFKEQEKLFGPDRDYSKRRVSTGELSVLMGITPRRIQQLANEVPAFGKASVGHGIWVCSKAITAYIDYRIQENENRERKGESSKARLERAKADMAELELQELQGKLVRIDTVHSVYEEVLMNVKAQILTLPRRIAMMKLPNGVREREVLLVGETEKSLQKLSEYGNVRHDDTRNGKETREITLSSPCTTTK